MLTLKIAKTNHTIKEGIDINRYKYLTLQVKYMNIITG